MTYQTAPVLMQSLATSPCTEWEEVLTITLKLKHPFRTTAKAYFVSAHRRRSVTSLKALSNHLFADTVIPSEVSLRSCSREDRAQSIVVVVDIGRSEAKSPASGIIVVEGGAYVILLDGHEA